MTVRDLNALQIRLNDVLAVKALLEEFETVPPTTRIQRLVQMFDRASKSGTDLTSLWTGVRTLGLIAVNRHEIALRAAMVAAANEVASDNTP